MSRADVSEADLLRALHALQASSVDADLVAQTMGFSRIAPVLPAEKQRQTRDRARRIDKPNQRTHVDTLPEAGTQAPWFWRLASQLPLGPQAASAPAWLAAQALVTDQSIEAGLADGQALQPLTSAHRFATFIRRHLAVAMRSAEPDTDVAVQRIARGQSLANCPALIRKRWPGGVHLVLDASPHLWPLALDLGLLALALERLLGHRLRLYRCAGLPGQMQDVEMRAASLPADGAPVVVLGDAGLMASAARRQGAWVDWGLRQQRGGRRALLLAPVPANLVSRRMAQAFDVVPLGQGGGLRWAAGETGAAVKAMATTNLAPGEALLRDLLFGNSYVEAPLLRRLRRLLNAQGHTLTMAAEVAVWRDASVVSDPGGCTLHPDERQAAHQRLLAVDSTVLLAALAEHWDALRSASPLVRAEFAVWWQALLQQRSEAGPWLQVIAAAALESADLMCSVAAALWTQPEQAAAMAAYLRRFGQRSADLLGTSDGHQLAWTMAQREAIAAGSVALPGSIELATVHWVLGEPSGGLPMNLKVEGEMQAVNGGQARLAWAPLSPSTGVALAGAVEVGRLWSVHAAPSKTQDSLQWVESLVKMLKSAVAADDVAALHSHVLDWLHSRAPQNASDFPPEQRKDMVKARAQACHRLADRVVETALELLAVERLAHELHGWFRTGSPTWPDQAAATAGLDTLPALLAAALTSQDLQGMARHRVPVRPFRRHLPREAALTVLPQAQCTLTTADQALVVEATSRPPWADAMAWSDGALRATLADGRELAWVPAAEWRLTDAAEGSAYRLLQGCWWDALEFKKLLPGSSSGSNPVLTKPGWASRHGVDGHGYWAEWVVGSAVQRMRFIPPGRFWMGSPLAEVGRSEREILHAVTLTRGCWLADTACTQAMWQAVTGSLPKGNSKTEHSAPVTEVSYTDITDSFMPMLNRRLPSFNGRLPSEAEWEYAARAGSVTAYPWGDKQDAERMNFREEANRESSGPLPVKNFPANAWGLWQMHGNVWEWCGDEFEPYPEHEVLDPTGPSKAPTEAAGRVLRGGSWINGARSCRSGGRNANVPGYRNSFGFRLARGLPEAGRAEPGSRAASGLPAEPAPVFDPGSGAPGSVLPSQTSPSSRRRASGLSESATRKTTRKK